MEEQINTKMLIITNSYDSAKIEHINLKFSIYDHSDNVPSLRKINLTSPDLI